MFKTYFILDDVFVFITLYLFDFLMSEILDFSNMFEAKFRVDYFYKNRSLQVNFLY